MKDYWQRIKFMIAWIETEYAEYYEMGTVKSLHSKRGIPVCISLSTRETLNIPE
jgi:hypothetical protein